MKTALILGATGQVGQELLQLALRHPEISRVVAPTRRPLPPHAKLENPLVDFEVLPEGAPWWKADLALSALGTTLRQTKSREGFYHVDHDYNLAAAELARRSGTPVFGLVSSLGANASSCLFYLRVKGETERDLSALGFDSLTLVRPSLLIGGPRSSARRMEAFGLFLGKHLASILPRRYRAVTTFQVAHALLENTLRAPLGINVIESEQLHEIIASSQ
ncbi:MAG: NAD-dependent dehydratase [Methylococcaceae bacterium]|nr:NAD-dependent dehydratase [Methylococcaceae bacterium]